MLKNVLLVLSILLLSQASASDYSRSNEAAKEAVKNLDCDFGDCPKPAPEAKVIIQEKVIIKEVPVVVEKEVIVEKIVYKDNPVAEVVPAPAVEEEVAPVAKPKAVVTNRVYNKAFFDVHTPTQAPMLDYINFAPRASFDIKQYVDTVSKIKERNTKVYIHGQIAVPDSITTSQVYMNVGQKYHFSYYSSWQKDIYYNGSKTPQNSDYFLVDVKSDNNGNRYVDYKIYLFLSAPWKLKESEENVAPNSFFFKMAPKTRGFKNEFVNAKVYIIEE